MKTISIPDETFEFLAYLARQDVTLPAVLVEYLKWNYTQEEIKRHLHTMTDACIETREKK